MKPSAQDPLRNLTHEITLLRKQIAKMNNLKFSFLRGITIGVGSALGASVIATLLATILWRIIKAIGIK